MTTFYCRYHRVKFGNIQFQAKKTRIRLLAVSFVSDVDFLSKGQKRRSAVETQSEVHGTFTARISLLQWELGSWCELLWGSAVKTLV